LKRAYYGYNQFQLKKGFPIVNISIYTSAFKNCIKNRKLRNQECTSSNNQYQKAPENLVRLEEDSDTEEYESEEE